MSQGVFISDISQAVFINISTTKSIRIIPPAPYCLSRDNAFDTSSRLRHHPCPCPTGCGYVVSCSTEGYEDQLFMHMNKYHHELVCPMCYETFSSPARKIEHNNLHHFVCEECPWKSFDNEEALIDHYRMSHSRVETFCTECEAYCTGPRDLREHMDKYHVDSGNDFDHHPGMHRRSNRRKSEAGYDASYSDRNQRTAATEIRFGSSGATYGGSVLPEISDRTSQSWCPHHGTYERPAPRDNPSDWACYKDGVWFEPGLRPQLNDSRRPPPSIPRPTGQHMHGPGRYPRQRRPSSPAHHAARPNPHPRHPFPHTNPHRHTTGLPEPAAHEDSPDFYALFDLSPSASQAEVERAVRKKRIEVHPDRLKRVGMSSEDQAWIDRRARIVGGAAEVLLDVGRRREYDERMAARREGARMRMRRW